MPRDADTLIADDLSAIVLATLGADEASITGMLECIAKRMGSFGAGLWEIGPRAELNRARPKGVLITVASWWESGDLFAMDDVPLADSPAASVAVTQQAVIVGDIRKAGGAKKGHPFWKRHRVQGMCAVPIRYLNGSLGVLNVYRCEGASPFTEEDRQRLEKMAALVPGLFRAVREKIGLYLVSEVEKLLRDAGRTTESASFVASKRTTVRDVRRVLGEICKLVSKAFNSVEASVFLEDPQALPGTTYRLMATTEPRCARHRVYRTKNDHGRLTGWVLAHCRPLRVRDLVNFDRDWESVKETYPGLTKRSHGQHDIREARKRLGLKRGDDAPPLSFMAVPIFGGTDWFGETDLRGALRCHMARTRPFYFSEREEALLSVVAAQIGQWWARWRTRIDLERENQAWNKIVKRIGQLNTFVHTEFVKARPDEGAVFREALRLTADVIPGAVLNGVRMYDEKTEELYFAQFSTLAEREIKRQKLDVSRRFKNVPNSKHAGVHVFRSGKPWMTKNARANSLYHAIFPFVERMVIVPVGVEEKRFGLLDLRWTTKPIPSYALQMATLLGRQLGIYHQLALLVTKHREAVADAERQKLEETNANEDFSHQLRTPIAEAQMRVELAIDAYRGEYERRPLYIVRGLFRRAERVAMSMRLLSELSHGRKLTLNPVPLDSEALLRKMIEMADDSQASHEEKRIRFTVEREGFRPSVIRPIRADVGLLEQMISNMLDNAGKYSRRNSEVHIRAGISKSGYHYLAVINKGLTFRPGETEHCKQRGWRSPEARLIATAGRGIGLWLVSEIMKAHNGQLQIFSPNKDQETEMRLAFLNS